MSSSENMDYRALYHSWFESMTDDENRLYGAVLECEDKYFADMTFKPNSVVAQFIECEVQGDDGEFFKSYEDVPDWLSSIDNMNYRFHVAELDKDIVGRVNREERTITISPEYANDKPSILHEMIHVYEENMNACAMFYHDILTLCLYNDLKSKIDDLDERIINHTHVIHGVAITAFGGEHDVLFFLKSLDLDLRCGYKLGTVCGYGRDEDI